jgi:hypothetical protein
MAVRTYRTQVRRSYAGGNRPGPRMDGLRGSERIFGIVTATYQPTAQLTREQRVFAEREHAVPGRCGGRDHRSVFMYREEALAAWRWLVDPNGRVVDTERFSRL